MEFTFPHYLLSKQSVDDRSLNHRVYQALVEALPAGPIRIIEVGAGIGTMLRRLIRWGKLTHGEYIAVDEMAENIHYGLEWISHWATETGLGVERIGQNRLRLFDETHDLHVTFEQADVFDFIERIQKQADLLIAHAFLDLLPMPKSLPKLFSLTSNLAWLTINFDGMTTFEPPIDRALDEKIERLYHETMDIRPTGGDSHTGRHLFEHLRSSKANILAAGASDWVVYPQNGYYPADEAYFLHCILHFFKSSLAKYPELDPSTLAAWLSKRESQIENGELVYIAHQMDFLVQV